jgi:hypothetical protein
VTSLSNWVALGLDKISALRTTLRASRMTRFPCEDHRSFSFLLYGKHKPLKSLYKRHWIIAFYFNRMCLVIQRRHEGFADTGAEFLARHWNYYAGHHGGWKIW